MAMTGYYRTMQRPRAHQPLSMLKYDPIGTTPSLFHFFEHRACLMYKISLGVGQAQPRKRLDFFYMKRDAWRRRNTADNAQCGNKYSSSRRNAARNRTTFTSRIKRTRIENVRRASRTLVQVYGGSENGRRRWRIEKMEDSATMPTIWSRQQAWSKLHACTHMYYTVSMARRYIRVRAEHVCHTTRTIPHADSHAPFSASFH
jgi:hypothetical protein